ncbi:MAG: hypothetical protein GX306_02475 [Clostridiales bacterium]|nr:hypothetical protein [Clostridiales bacterium]
MVVLYSGIYVVMSMSSRLKTPNTDFKRSYQKLRTSYSEEVSKELTKDDRRKEQK